jgi:hypothetical protein
MVTAVGARGYRGTEAGRLDVRRQAVTTRRTGVKKTIAMGREKPYKIRPFAPVLMVRLKAELPEGQGAYEPKLVSSWSQHS